MFIKQVIIQGFKSYKEQTVIEPFSPQHNVIVGRNGSGKSNFFAAIRFVLGDAYTQMGREERQALLHEGTGAAVMSAFVEIIFDNTDDRFPTGRPELVLRRTIGSKKDEYTLDRKNATKNDVMNLLESAGFSRSNPYYIVPQGRVTALTNMKDGERLTLLKEVAGTQVYEARRAESLKIMQETDNKRGKIDDLLNYIKERLTELEEEKEELRDYQDKDKERRSLQYTIDHREQMAIANELDVIDEQRQNGVDGTDESREQFVDGEKQLSIIENEIKQLKQQAQFLQVDKNSLDSDRRDAAKDKARLELEMNELNAGQQSTQQNRLQMEEEIESIREDISTRERNLADMLPEFTEQSTEVAAVKEALDLAEATRQRLYSKQSRNSRFKSKKERDTWLDKQIDDAYPRVAQISAVRVQTQEEVKELNSDVEKGENKLEQLRAQLSAATGEGEGKERLQEAKAERDKLSETQKELWREEAKLQSMIDTAKRELYDADRKLYQKMDKNTSRGLDSVRRIVKQHKIEGVYGTMAELMDCGDRYKTSVEVVAGNSLFHWIVDNDDTASQVLEILNKERGGRVTFMPLNRLKPHPTNVKAQDAIPMLEKVKYNEAYEAAFQQVFGKTIICPSIQIASQYARSHNVSAITLDGDRSDKKGALTGGYIDTRQSRLDAVRAQSKWRQELEAHESRRQEIGKELSRLSQRITQATGVMRGLEQAKLRAERGVDGVRQEIRHLEVDLLNKRDTAEAKGRALVNVEASAKSLAEQQEAYRSEKGTPFQKALTDDEEKQLEGLSAEVQDLRKQFSDISSTRSQLLSRKQTLEIELRENFRPRLSQLEQLLQEQGDSTSDRIKDVKRELKRASKSLDTLEKKHSETEAELDERNARIAELEQNRADAVQQQSDLAKSIEKQKKRMEKSIQKKAILQKQANEVAARIRDLGVLPQEAFAKFEKMKSEAVVKRLHKVNDALKKYSHVNKKAFQQYDQFTGQREQLTKRREELDSSQTSIEELIAVLDQRKDEAIERTFKQVSKEFAAVFETLVPAGRGRLIIQRRQDRSDEQDSDEEERSNVENYTGVGIAVSFNSKHDDQQRIQQLSGGQKSLCALALVFAIQRCDPAPFYLFDEIDANLDAQYRTAVAQMLQNISHASESDGQFICTTFRPEMLLVADKCYGVRYVGKSSSVVQVSREDAMEFVQGEAPR